METGIDNPKFINLNKGKKEIGWWKDKPQSLIQIPDTGNSYRLIYTLRSEKEPKEARAEVLIAIEEAGRMWRKKLEEKRIKADNLFISITSLLRGQELQEEIKRKSVNANDTSSHLFGAAADIDPNGSYLLEKGNFTPINSSNYKNIEDLRKALFETLIEMEKEELISFIPEFEPREDNKSTLSCFHICPNPDIEKMLKGE